MNAIGRLITNEPVMTQGVIQAALAMATSFGLGWTAEQVGMTLAFTAAVLAWITRQQVTPTAKQD